MTNILRENCFQVLAAFLARKFNALLPPDSKQIKFLEVGVYEGETQAGTPFYFNFEELLPDYLQKFTKWCSNANYINRELVSLVFLVTVRLKVAHLTGSYNLRV